MNAYLLDWANLLLRWLHVIVAIAWIGASLHFVLLDDSLQAPDDEALRRRGVGGEAWAVHGGGFYHTNKYLVAPPNLPAKLHWSYWESYATWLSGFALLTVLYFANASTFLIDPARFVWTPAQAVAGAIVYLVIGWLVYDTLCRTVGRSRAAAHASAGAGTGAVVGNDPALGVLVFVYVCVAAWVACRLFAGRAAFVLTGAMLATIMSANVAMVIIPGQRKVVAALRAGAVPDPNHGRRAKQRSVHNTYLTLPVLVAMLSNHYGEVSNHPHNALALVLLMLAGAVIRAFFVLRHKAPPRWGLAAAGVALIGSVVWLVRPPATEPPPAGAAGESSPPFAEVAHIVATRCQPCHNAVVANKGVQLHTAALIVRNAPLIEQQAVVLRAMPMNNATGITEAERAVLGRWTRAGAPGP